MKIYTKFLIVLTGVFFYFLPASAQYFIPEKKLAEQLKTRTVIVELYPDSAGIPNACNDVLQNAFKEYWTLTPVEFLPAEKFKEILKTGDTRYAAFLPYNGEHTLTMERVEWGTGSVIHSKSFYFDHFDFALSLITGPDKEEPVTTISFANDNLMTSDLLFAVQQIARLVNASLNDIKGPDYFDHKKNIEFVKTKILLIPREYIKEKEIADIDEKYEFPHRLVTLDEMNTLILSKDDQYIYPKIMWSMMHNAYGWITIWAKDGSITSFMSFGGIHTKSNQSANEVIKPGHLKYITSGTAQGMNNRYK